jgi:hypothetical protein
MKTSFLPGLMGAGLMMASLVLAQTPKTQPTRDTDLRRAIAFERYKDIAAARQARKEARHPSVTYSQADRSADRSADQSQGTPVKDPGPAIKKDRN